MNNEIYLAAGKNGEGESVIRTEALTEALFTNLAATLLPLVILIIDPASRHISTCN